MSAFTVAACGVKLAFLNLLHSHNFSEFVANVSEQAQVVIVSVWHFKYEIWALLFRHHLCLLSARTNHALENRWLLYLQIWHYIRGGTRWIVVCVYVRVCTHQKMNGCTQGARVSLGLKRKWLVTKANLTPQKQHTYTQPQLFATHLSFSASTIIYLLACTYSVSFLSIFCKAAAAAVTTPVNLLLVFFRVQF